MTGISMIITQILYSWRSDIPYMFVVPDSFYPPLVNVIMNKISKNIDDDSLYLHTFLLTLVVIIFTVGFAKYCTGKFGLLKLTDYIPYPVVCGLMSGIGINVIQLSIVLSTRNELKFAFNYLPALFVGFISILAHKLNWNPAVTFTIIITTGVTVFYSLLYYNDTSIDDAETSNWIFGKSTEGK